uniref:Type-1 angiotensin II receptor-associated protein n=1 Tax=Denticeps clupeoides TaxID=299321 RepID=A0AAY4EW25_9TELE
MVLTHWLLTILASMFFPGLQVSYMWGNFSAVAISVWVIAQKDSSDAALMYFLGMILTIITDIIILGFTYQVVFLAMKDSSIRFGFSAAVANVVLKGVSCYFIHVTYRKRGGNYKVDLGLFTPNQPADHQVDSSKLGTMQL